MNIFIYFCNKCNDKNKIKINNNKKPKKKNESTSELEPTTIVFNKLTKHSALTDCATACWELLQQNIYFKPLFMLMPFSFAPVPCRRQDNNSVEFNLTVREAHRPTKGQFDIIG